MSIQYLTTVYRYKKQYSYHTIFMIPGFLLYGMLGWIMEILWTGLHSLLKKDYSLMGQTSLWMFPIYGTAVFLEPLFLFLADVPPVVRGGIYMICIYMAEYASGWGLQRVAGVCPWDYSESKYHVNGLIRLDYAPVWFTVGLFFESIFYHFLY